MCHNAPTSIGGFLLGSLAIWLLAADVRRESMTLLCLWWQFVVFVQLAEFFVWLDQDCASGLNRWGTTLLNALLMSQPVVLYLLFSGADRAAKTSGRVLSALTAVYVFAIVCCLLQADQVDCTFPASDCAHLSYRVGCTFTNFLYGAVIVGCLCTLVRPRSVGLFAAAGFLGTALISLASCGQASVWCSFAVVGPLFLWAFCRLCDPYDTAAKREAAAPKDHV